MLIAYKPLNFGQWRKRNKKKLQRGSKMVTGIQTQTTWALWIGDLAEMLQTHLAEVKHQGELKLQHPELLACGRLLHTTIHWKNKWPPHCCHLPGLCPWACQPTTHWPTRPLLCRTARLPLASLPGFCPAGPPGCPPLPTRPLPCRPTRPLLAYWLARLLPRLPARSLLHRTARPPLARQHTGHHLPQEGSNTTRHWLQTCLGDADK
jgi:hypothetical protein